MSPSRSHSSSSSSSSSSGSSKHSDRRTEAIKSAAKATVLGAIQTFAGQMSSTQDQQQQQQPPSERDSLLHHFQPRRDGESVLPSVNSKQATVSKKAKGTIWAVLVALMIAALVVFMRFPQSLPDSAVLWLGGLPLDPMAAAYGVLKQGPIIVRPTKFICLVLLILILALGWTH